MIKPTSPNPKTAPGAAALPGVNRPYDERRRSQRVLVRMPVVMHIEGKAPIRGDTHTVSAGAAMVIVPDGLSEGTRVTLENAWTKMKVDAKIARPPQMNHAGSLVLVQFVTPSPTFWNIYFPPFD